MRDRTLELAAEKQLSIFKARMLDVIHNHRTAASKIRPSAATRASLNKVEAVEDVMPQVQTSLTFSHNVQITSRGQDNLLKIGSASLGLADAHKNILTPAEVANPVSNAAGEVDPIQADLVFQEQSGAVIVLAAGL